MKFTMPEGATIEIAPGDIVAAHENTKKSWVNIFTQHGEFIVLESEILPFLSGFRTGFVRFNPSTEANRLGVKTLWEDGIQYGFWFRVGLPVARYDGIKVVCFFGKRMRYEE